LLASDRWSVLEEICNAAIPRADGKAPGETPVSHELVAMGYTMPGNALKPVRDREEASQTLTQRDLKTAAGVGNVETVKQLTWASLKFQIRIQVIRHQGICESDMKSS